MDDLEINPLYRAFLGKFRREFEIACKMSYVIAIPHSDTLDDIQIDQYFANTHILVPSKLLRMHYTSLQVGFYDDIEIDGSKLICYIGKQRLNNKIIVNILDEEIGYNNNNKEYRTILIDKPLLLNNSRPLIRSILAPLTPRSALSLPSSSISLNLSKQRRLKSSKSLNHHDDCFRYLECISSRLSTALEEDVRRLQSNYMILSHYLDDAASRTSQLAESYIPRFESALETTGIIICDTIRRSIRLSVENCIVHLLHGKLIVALHNLNEKEDEHLKGKFDEIYRANLTICQLGAQKTFSEFIIEDNLINELRQMSNQQSPIALVSSLIRIIKLIDESLNQSARFKRLLGTIYGNDQDGDAKEQSLMATICSDDLIASLVFCLAQVKPDKLFSTMRYLELFGSSSIERDQAAYYSATFQVVIQYIFNFKQEKPQVIKDKIDDVADDDYSHRPEEDLLGPKQKMSFNCFAMDE